MLINQLDTRPQLSLQPQHMVQHLGTRPRLHPIQAIRLTAAQAVIHQQLPHSSTRDIANSHRVVAIHRPVVGDQATNSHRDTTKAEGISLVVAVIAAAGVTKVVGIKVIVGVVAAVAVVADMGSRALPMGRAVVVVMEAAEEGRFRFSLYHLIMVILYFM